MYKSRGPETSFDAHAFTEDVRDLVSDGTLSTRGQPPAEVAKDAFRFYEETRLRFTAELDTWLEAGLLSDEWPDTHTVTFDREAFVESFSKTIRMLTTFTDKASEKGMGPGKLSELSDADRHEVYTVWFAQYAELLSRTAEEDRTVSTSLMKSNAVLYHTAEVFDIAKEEFGSLPRSVVETYVFASPGKGMAGLRTLARNVSDIVRKCPEITPANAVWIACKSRDNAVKAAHERLATAKELSARHPDLKQYVVFDVVMRYPRKAAEIVQDTARGFRGLTETFPDINESHRAMVARLHGADAVPEMRQIIFTARHLAETHASIPDSLRWQIALFHGRKALQKADAVVETATKLQARYPEVPPSWLMLMAVSKKGSLRKIDEMMRGARDIGKSYPEIPEKYRLRLALNHSERCRVEAGKCVIAETTMCEKYPELTETQRWHIAVYYDEPLEAVAEIMTNAEQLHEMKPDKGLAACVNYAIKQRNETKELLLEEDSP